MLALSAAVHCIGNESVKMFFCWCVKMSKRYIMLSLWHARHSLHVLQPCLQNYCFSTSIIVAFCWEM